MNKNLTTASLKATIDTPLIHVWQTIKAFDGVEKYLPMVDSCHLELDNGKTNRVCSVSMGSDPAKFVERLDFIEEKTHSIGYSVIEGPEIFLDATGIITVTALSEDTCEISFSGTFRGENNIEAKTMALQIYSMIVDGLKKLHTNK